MWQSVWWWLQSLQGAASTVVGAAIGSFLALVSLSIAALFNAHLNRRRDDRIRTRERRALAIALRVELAGIARTLEENAKDLREAKSDFSVPDVRHSVRVMPELISKLGLLDPDAIQKTLDAHILIDQYYERLRVLGGTPSNPAAQYRRLMLMPERCAHHVAIVNEVTAEKIHEAMYALARNL